MPWRGELAVHDVPLEQDRRLAVVEEALAIGFHFVDRVDAGKGHVEAFGGFHQVVIAQQLGAVPAG